MRFLTLANREFEHNFVHFLFGVFTGGVNLLYLLNFEFTVEVSIEFGLVFLCDFRGLGYYPLE